MNYIFIWLLSFALNQDTSLSEAWLKNTGKEGQEYKGIKCEWCLLLSIKCIIPSLIPCTAPLSLKFTYARNSDYVFSKNYYLHKPNGFRVSLSFLKMAFKGGIFFTSFANHRPAMKALISLMMDRKSKGMIPLTMFEPLQSCLLSIALQNKCAHVGQIKTELY